MALAPDLADLRLGVAVSRPTVDAARAEAARLMDAILAAVDAAGVARRDVRTALLSVQPRYDYRENKPPTLTGYELANVVEVTVRDLARLGDVVDGTLGAGATSMDGLSFRIADPTDAEREARILAMAQARARADVLAEAAGLAIDGVAEVVEGVAGSAARAAAQGRADDDGGRCRDTGRGRLAGGRGRGDRHLPGALIRSSSPAAGRWPPARRPRRSAMALMLRSDSRTTTGSTVGWASAGMAQKRPEQ